jgi:hypothetical protein
VNVGCIADVSQVHAAYTFNVNPEAECTSETSTISSTTTWFNNTKTELTPIINHRKMLKVVQNVFKYLVLKDNVRSNRTFS